MKYCMIVNPNAGKKQGRVIAEKATRDLLGQGIEIEILISEKPGETVDIAAALDPELYDGVLAVGGDGTLFEVLNGLMKRSGKIDLPIGQIPVGTGNSFIKDLGITDSETAVKAIQAGKTREIDLGEFTTEGNSFVFINLLGTGFVSNVAYRAKKYKSLGPLSYILGVVEEVAVLKSTDIELEIDGSLFKRTAVFVEICNSRYTGGDMMMAPGAEIDDGMLDVVLLNRISRRKLLRLFPSIFSGRHVEDSSVEVFRGQNISLKSARPLLLTPDGETFGKTPIDVKINSHKIRMFC